MTPSIAKNLLIYFIKRKFKACYSPAVSGFTLIEMVISGALTLLVIGGAAAALIVAQRTSRNQGVLAQLESLIDNDLSAIQELDRRFTCCTGNPCTTAPSAIAESEFCRAANGATVTPGDENYYSPRQSNNTTTTEFSNFQTACANGSIASSFHDLLPSVAAAPPPGSITRNVEESGDSANLLTLTYEGRASGITVTTRVINIIPIAASWCP